MPVSSLVLQHCDLFASASEAVVQAAAAQMDMLHLKRREVLMLRGRPFAGFGVVLQGRIQAMDHTVDGREVALATVDAHGAFGVADLIAARPAQTTWVAAMPTTLAVMPPPAALHILQSGDMGFLVAKDLAQQVCDLISWQKMLAVNPVGARICAWLHWAAAGASEVQLPTHAELAWRLNTTRESVTRTLQRLQADGVLRRDGELWRVERPAQLAEMARGEGAL